MTGLLRRASSLLRAQGALGRGSQARGMASDHADHFVNFWEKPTAPSEWKPEQATLIIFAGWASVIAFFTRGDGKDPTEKILEARYQALKEGKPLPGEKAEKGHGGHGKKEAHGHH